MNNWYFVFRRHMKIWSRNSSSIRNVSCSRTIHWTKFMQDFHWFTIYRMRMRNKKKMLLFVCLCYAVRTLHAMNQLVTNAFLFVFFMIVYHVRCQSNILTIPSVCPYRFNLIRKCATTQNGNICQFFICFIFHFTHTKLSFRFFFSSLSLSPSASFISFSAAVCISWNGRFIQQCNWFKRCYVRLCVAFGNILMAIKLKKTFLENNHKMNLNFVSFPSAEIKTKKKEENHNNLIFLFYNVHIPCMPSLDTRPRQHLKWRWTNRKIVCIRECNEMVFYRAFRFHFISNKFFSSPNDVSILCNQYSSKMNE